MSSRVVGAGLALIAAALFAVSIATPVVVPAELSLFAGHRTVDGRTFEMQDAYVGFYSAQVCNTGGDGTCQNANPRSAFKIAAFADLGMTGLLGASVIVLALLALQKSERGKGAARFVRVLTVTAAAGMGVLIVLGPTERGAIPLGIGMGMYGGAILSAFLASVIAVRPPQPLKLRVADRASQPVAAMPAAPPAFDMQALFGEDQMRPRELGPEPTLRRDARARPEPPPPQSASQPDGAPDPFAMTFPQPGQPAQPVQFPQLPQPPQPQHPSDKPLFSSAPQLRPLYDATPLQGGTGGLLPIERPVMPTRPPTPLPRAAISAVAGIPTPPPFPAERPKTLPPPNFGVRAKPVSIPPPVPPGALPRTQVSLVPPMPDNGAPMPPPAVQRAPLPGMSDRRAPLPGVSDGSPEVAESPPNTEPNMVPGTDSNLVSSVVQSTETPLDPAPVADAPMPRPYLETPLAAPPVPSAPMPRPRIETPLAPPPPPIAPTPRPRRESKELPRPQRDSESPRPGLRAAVPMPERPGRQAPSPTRPPPVSIPVPLRGAPTRPPIGVPGAPGAFGAPPLGIPPIPAIPSIPMLPNRAETDPHERAETVDQEVDQATASRAPFEIGDNTSQTDVSIGAVSAEELDAAVDEIGAPRSAPGDVSSGIDIDDAIDASKHGRGTPAELGFPDTSMPARSVVPADTSNVVFAAPLPAIAPIAPIAPAPPAPMPIVVAPPVTPLVRDRPMPKLPISTAPDSLPPPKDTKQQTGPSPACPQCESPMAWVEEHLRFYCKSCRMYF